MTELREPSTLVLDIDGTLVTYDTSVPDSAARAISAARRVGTRSSPAPVAPSRRCTRTCGTSGWTG